MKELIILTIIGIVIGLGHAMFSMVSVPTDSKAMVKALTVRVGTVGGAVCLPDDWLVHGCARTPLTAVIYSGRMKLYQELAADLTSLIRQGTLQAGERIPSVRELCRERGVSPATAMRAYDVLEANGLVESRHRLGYYVSNRWQQAPSEPRASQPPARSTQVDVSDLVFNILRSIARS